MGTFIFRCDGNSSVGAGHVMRCLSIADGFSAQGQQVLLITAGEEFSSIITAHGHRNIVFRTPYDHLDEELSQFLPELL